jgi:NitT/TauT family transport system ATP-binding protein
MTAQDGAIVSLRGVSKTFDNGTTAIDGLNFEVSAGEFVSLLGPSGCGKSTALRIIAGLSEASRGDVVSPSQQSGAADQIGFVFQDPTLLPWATVTDNVLLPFTLRAAVDAQPQLSVAEALSRVGLADFADAFPRELSGGMRMRASIARALVTKPRLLLMDEPFAALDEITRFKLNNDLLSVWHHMRGTVVFVTHSVFESVFLSQRILVMTPRPGRIFTEVDIPAPYPRDERFRTSAEYAGYCRRVSEALGHAMGAGP